MSSSTLEIKNNFYVVKSGLLFNYFPIKIVDTEADAPLFRFEKTPPVIMEGVAIIGKKLYHATPADLLRGVIRKSREIAIAKREGINGKSESKSVGSTGSGGSSEGISGNIVGDVDVREAIQHPDEQRAGAKTELEIGKAADAAWQEQIGTLLDYLSEEEGIEWEVADSA